MSAPHADVCCDLSYAVRKIYQMLPPTVQTAHTVRVGTHTGQTQDYRAALGDVLLSRIISTAAISGPNVSC